MSGFTWDWGVIWYAIPYMLTGTVVTIEVSLAAIVIGTVLGGACGLLTLAHSRALTLPVRAYIYFVRGTPSLVQVFLIYYALPVIGIDLSPFWGGVAALAFNAGGFIAEIVRAGLQSIDPGQTEAAMSIGLTHRQTLLYILSPQAARRIVPPLTNEMISTFKGSSLLSVISISELTRSAQVIIAERFTPFEIYAVLAVFYLVLISILSQISAYIERQLR